ncbi:MAG: amidohydrolase family protein, partial [Dehalococcoidia bacterium]|nr:amidohydrolase family protein [Dehalococcoidia bacterium]
MIIDVHHHFIPGERIENIQKYLLPGQSVEKQGATMVVKDGKWRCFNLNRLYHSIEDQILHLDEGGIDMAVQTIGCYHDWTTGDVAPGINDAMAEIQAKYPRRVIGIAHVPPFDETAPRELERCVKVLGLKGVTINTNTKGKYPDARAFAPLYRKVVELDIPIVVHAASLPGTEYMRKITREGIESPALARSIDHMIATMRIITGGVLKEFPSIKFIMGHLGGSGFFTLMERLGMNAGTQVFREITSHLFFDTAPVGWGKSTLACAIDTYGVDNVLMGSDYPAVVSDGSGLKKAV